MESINIFTKILQKFDHIYLLTLSHRKDRQYGILTQLKELGYDENNIEHIKKFSIIYTTSWPYNIVIANAINQHFNRYSFTKPNEYDCTRNHYNIIKTAYDLGYEKILIMEDDLQWLKPRMLNNFLTNFPEDYSMVQMSGYSSNTELSDICTQQMNGGVFFFPYMGNIWCTALYAVSRTGMEHYMHSVEQCCTVADMPIFNHPKSGYYISSWPLAIQANHNLINSDIRNQNNDKIDYANSNAYEFIDKTKYYDYPTIKSENKI